MTRVMRFGDIVTEVQRFVEVYDDVEYACAGVRLHGKGVFIREYKFGREILKKFVQHTVHPGDIVFSTLFARNGAFAVADDDVDGAVLSEKFPTFRLEDSRVTLDYLKWFFRSGYLAELSAKQVTGVAAFSLSHLSKKKFLNLPVPVPDLERQARVVSLCEEAYARAHTLSDSAGKNRTLLEHIVPATTERVLADTERLQLGSLGEYMTRAAVIRPADTYAQITVAMRHRGLRLRRTCLGQEIRSPGQCYVQAGDVLFSRIDLRNGAIGVVSDDLAGAVVTRDFPVFRLHDTTTEALEMLMYVFRSPCFMKQAQDSSRGTTGRKKLKRERFLEFVIPWPSAEERPAVLSTLKACEASARRILRECHTQEAALAALPKAVSATLFAHDGEDSGVGQNRNLGE